MRSVPSIEQNRLAVDIGGTFTDVVLQSSTGRYSTKLLTTVDAPEDAVIAGIDQVLQQARLNAMDVDMLLHGTTLATNALIERKGALTAFITTAGFRDVLEMGFEKRFAQYNLDACRPDPLVPRTRRFEVGERISAKGRIITPLQEAELENLAAHLRDSAIESVAIGFLHAYAHPAHELRVQEKISAALPEISVCRSSEICPELREYERFSTTVANAYVQPLIAGYLKRLEERLSNAGFTCQIFLMQSGGGLMTLDQAVRVPIRLVESGPAGGAILAAQIASARKINAALSFDMGGTTAKIALIDNGQPARNRRFEIAREYRDMKGSGLPVRIPVIDMVEIGAGGGSIASVDNLQRIKVGPESAGSNPGPICYQRGGNRVTVTDANLVLGKIDTDHFAGGQIALSAEASQLALQQQIGDGLSFDSIWSAAGITEMVEENMANAARVHAIEQGKEPSEYSMIAFGGCAPLHAARLADKLGIRKIIIPPGAGVGSAIGFLLAPVSYQVVRSFLCDLQDIDLTSLNHLLEQMGSEAGKVVSSANPSCVKTTREVEMRYLGQGHELAIALPQDPIVEKDLAVLREEFEARYQSVYNMTMPDNNIECVSWTVSVTEDVMETQPIAVNKQYTTAHADTQRSVYDTTTASMLGHSLYQRSALTPGQRVSGPAIIVENETTTVVPSNYSAEVDSAYAIVLSKESE